MRGLKSKTLNELEEILALKEQELEKEAAVIVKAEDRKRAIEAEILKVRLQMSEKQNEDYARIYKAAEAKGISIADFLRMINSLSKEDIMGFMVEGVHKMLITGITGSEIGFTLDRQEFNTICSALSLFAENDGFEGYGYVLHTLLTCSFFSADGNKIRFKTGYGEVCYIMVALMSICGCCLEGDYYADWVGKALREPETKIWKEQ